MIGSRLGKQSRPSLFAWMQLAARQASTATTQTMYWNRRFPIGITPSSVDFFNPPFGKRPLARLPGFPFQQLQHSIKDRECQASNETIIPVEARRWHAAIRNILDCSDWPSDFFVVSYTCKVPPDTLVPSSGLGWCFQLRPFYFAWMLDFSDWPSASFVV